ncbi:MAG: SAM-dependent chlorinase/fluorinase [Flavipsychrobacter sp.]
MSCITLLSDLGLQDASLATAKGILMQHLPNIPIIDISNTIEPFHTQQAAYLLVAAYGHFNPNTVHIVLFDVFASKTPRLVLTKHQEQYILAPDNGILPLAFGESLGITWECYIRPKNGTLAEWVKQAAQVAQQISNGTPIDLPPTELSVVPNNLRPKVSANSIEGQVIHVDRFENVVLNIRKSEFDEVSNGRGFKVRFMRNEEITELSDHYSSVREGEKLCRFNTAGYLEIAINRGKAASLFGLKLQREQKFLYNTIKIDFE